MELHVFPIPIPPPTSLGRGVCTGEASDSSVLWPPPFMKSFFPQVKLTDWKQVSKTLGTGSTLLSGLQRASFIQSCIFKRRSAQEKGRVCVQWSKVTVGHRLLRAGPEMGLDLLRPFPPRKSSELEPPHGAT